MAGFGTAPTSPLPVVGSTIGPNWASQVNVAIAEVQGIVTPKIGPAQIDLGTNGELLHGPRNLNLSFAAGVPVGAPTWAGSTVMGWTSTAGTDKVDLALPLNVNDRILAVSVYGQGNGVVGWQINIYRVDMASGNATLVFGNTAGISGTVAVLNIGGLTETVAANKAYVLEWSANTGVGQKVFAAIIQYDKIATP